MRPRRSPSSERQVRARGTVLKKQCGSPDATSCRLLQQNRPLADGSRSSHHGPLSRPLLTRPTAMLRVRSWPWLC